MTTTTVKTWKAETVIDLLGALTEACHMVCTKEGAMAAATLPVIIEGGVFRLEATVRLDTDGAHESSHCVVIS